MYKLIGILFCGLEGILVARFGWIALLWSPLGFIFGLFSSANIILPILMGVPIAFSYVSKKEMRSMVFLALFRAPLIWLTTFFLLGWFFPTAFDWVVNNDTLIIGMIFGVIAILLSPLSKKGRDDFRSDFDKSYGKYYYAQNNFNLNYTDINDKQQLKQIEAVIRISSNLYLNSILNSRDILTFQYPDSRFRFMIFCLSATTKCCEDLISSFESLEKECLNFLSNITTSKESVQEYFSQVTEPNQAEKCGIVYLNEFMDTWNIYFAAVKSEDKTKASEVLCSMICSTENNKPIESSDYERLNQICWEIDFSLTHGSMRNAFIDLMAK